MRSGAEPFTGSMAFLHASMGGRFHVILPAAQIAAAAYLAERVEAARRARLGRHGAGALEVASDGRTPLTTRPRERRSKDL